MFFSDFSSRLALKWCQADFLCNRSDTDPHVVLPGATGMASGMSPERRLSPVHLPAEWPDAPACRRAPQPPGHCQTAASPGQLPTQPGLGKPPAPPRPHPGQQAAATPQGGLCRSSPIACSAMAADWEPERAGKWGALLSHRSPRRCGARFTQLMCTPNWCQRSACTACSWIPGPEPQLENIQGWG